MSQVTNVSGESNVELLNHFLAELATALREDHSSSTEEKPDPDIPQGLGFETWPTQTLETRWKELLNRAHHQDTLASHVDDRI